MIKEVANKLNIILYKEGLILGLLGYTRVDFKMFYSDIYKNELLINCNVFNLFLSSCWWKAKPFKDHTNGKVTYSYINYLHTLFYKKLIVSKQPSFIIMS